MTVGAIAGIAIWWPTMAMRPRYDYGPQPQQGSLWFFPLMIGATVVLTVVLVTHAPLVVPALIAPQLVLAEFTTPRGDNDGLWVLIFPVLVVLGAALYLGSAFVAWAVTQIRAALGARRPR